MDSPLLWQRWHGKGNGQLLRPGPCTPPTVSMGQQHVPGPSISGPYPLMVHQSQLTARQTLLRRSKCESCFKNDQNNLSA